MSFCSLYLKECKQILKSIIYIIFVGVVVIFDVSQFGDAVERRINQYKNPEKAIEGYHENDNLFIHPQEDDESYGYKAAEIPEQVMPNVLSTLIREYQSNSYIAYPIGFYKNVKLSASDNERVAEIIQDITGLTVKEATQIVEDYERGSLVEQADGFYYPTDPFTNPMDIPIIVSYEEFKVYMGELDKMIGGGSNYEVVNLSGYGREAITYEEKLAIYNETIYEDKILGAFARLFCDYMGIVIALFAVFVPVSYFMRDRKARIQELIYAREVSSVKLMLTKYLANVTMILIPFILLSLIPTVQLVAFGAYSGLPVDMFAFIKYIMVWLLPSILVTTAVGTFFTILTDTPLGIVIQFAVSFFDVFSNINSIGGGEYGFSLTLRHNTIGNYAGYKEGLSQLITNRITYSVIAIILLVLTMAVFELKRRGKINLGETWKKILGNIKGTNKAIYEK